jgi:hypothetical protein
MSNLNIVLNTQPTHPTATWVDAVADTMNTTKPGAPPGATGDRTAVYDSQLAKGNPGGIDAVGGVGITVDVGA